MDVTLKFDGPISQDNDARAYFNGNARPAQPADNDKLGKLRLSDPNTSVFGFGVAFEAKGVVSPADFNYPGVSLNLDRRIEAVLLINSNNVPVAQQPKWTADKSQDGFRDDKPPTLYDLDAPRGKAFDDDPVGTRRYVRANFEEFAIVAGIRASAFVPGWVRVGYVRGNTGSRFPSEVLDPDWVAGDNKGGTGMTKLTWNLQ